MQMKTGNISQALKIILLVISVIIVCILCGVIIGTANSGKAIVNSSTTQFKKLAAKADTITEATYDGNTFLGNEVTALINSTVENSERLSIVVRTLRNSRTDYNYTYDSTNNSIATGGTTTLQTNMSQDNYINRDAVFQCSVLEDDNDNIICLWFEQNP